MVLERHALHVGGRGVLHGDDRLLGAVAQRVRVVALGAAPRTRVAAQDGTLAAAVRVAQHVALVERRGLVVVLAEHAVLDERASYRALSSHI